MRVTRLKFQQFTFYHSRWLGSLEENPPQYNVLYTWTRNSCIPFWIMRALLSCTAWSWSRCSCSSKSLTLAIARRWSLQRRLPVLSPAGKKGRRGGGESICVVIRLWVSNLAQKRQLTILASTYVAALECMSIQRLLVAVYCCLWITGVVWMYKSLSQSFLYCVARYWPDILLDAAQEGHCCISRTTQCPIIGVFQHIAMVTQVATQRLCGFLSVYESLKLVNYLL